MQLLKLLVCFVFLFLVTVIPAVQTQEESFFRLQKSGRPMMKAFLNRLPYHNPMFTLREDDGGKRPFSGF